MYQIDLDNRNNGNPRVTTYIPFTGCDAGYIRMQIEGGVDQYDTCKLIIEPSRSVNPPFIQYFAGIEFNNDYCWSERKEVDYRFDSMKPLVESAMDIRYTSYPFTRWHVVRAVNMLTPMLAQLDREYNQRNQRKQKEAVA